MEYQNLIDSITPELYQRLRQAVEIGKWPDGTALSEQQKQDCLQAVIVWESRNLPEEQRSGFLPAKPGACGSSIVSVDDGEQSLRWKN